MYNLIRSSNALDLCYGQPQSYDMSLPSHMRHALKELVENAPIESHRYELSKGNQKLTYLLAQFYSRDTGRTIDPSEVLITVGATEALFCAIMSLVNPGDEVLLIEPAFECYDQQISVARGRLVSVQLKTKTDNGALKWVIPMKALESKVNDKTRMLILNTPHNPTGRAFTKSELEPIADLCKKYDIFCLADEVYDCLVHEDVVHARIASLEGMWERTITVGSAGKLFGVTGWRVGWAVGPTKFIDECLKIHIASASACPTLLQEVVAKGLEIEIALIGTEKSYWHILRQKLTKRKLRIIGILEAAGLTPIKHEAGYFIMADITSFAKKIYLPKDDDRSLDESVVRWMVTELGIGCVPGCCFFSSSAEDVPDNYIRFHYIVSEETLDELERKFQKLKDIIRAPQ